MRVPYLIVAATVVAFIAVPANAQTGRAIGVVVDATGRAIKGAVVTASNDQAGPVLITSTTDEKGRFAMIGLRAGAWTFKAEAPGYLSMEGLVPIRQATPGPPMRFVLQRSPEPIPGALARDIDKGIADGQALRAQGRYDQAIAAYQELLAKNPKLTTLHLVIAGTYREKAASEPEMNAKRALLDHAMAHYSEMLKLDAENDRARLELGATQLAAGNTAAGRATFQEILDRRPGSPAAAEAAAHLQGIRE